MILENCALKVAIRILSFNDPFRTLFPAFDMSENQRKYYRLPYPEPIMPMMRIGDSEYTVPEISEGGLRIRQRRRIGSTPIKRVSYW